MTILLLGDDIFLTVIFYFVFSGIFKNAQRQQKIFREIKNDENYAQKM
jgi:hypothetical protein